MISVISLMHVGTTTAVKIGGRVSGEFPVRVRFRLEPLSIHNCAISKQFMEGLPYELMYASDLFLIAESEKMLLEKIEAWRKGLEDGGPRVNFGKTKIMKCEIDSAQASSPWSRITFGSPGGGQLE